MCYAEVVIEASVNVLRRNEAFWLTESDWCFKKVFHTVFDVLVTWSFFVSNSVCFWRKGKCFTLLSQWVIFFFQHISYLRPIFVNLSTEKLIVAFEKKRLKKLKLKEDEIIGGKKESYFRRLFGPLHGKQEISKVLYSFFVWSIKWVERVFQTIIVQWKQSSSSQKKH